MNTTSILKIESDKGVALSSSDATQEVFLLAKSLVLRNLDSCYLPPSEAPTKYGCLVETSSAPSLLLLRPGEIFKIFSIVKFREDGEGEPSVEYVPDSLEKRAGFILFRPILKALLVNFKCKGDNAGPQTWGLEFEEI